MKSFDVKMSNNKMTVLQFVLFCLIVMINVAKTYDIHEICAYQTTCSKCMEASTICAWCSNPKYTGKSRCNIEAELIASNCEPKFINREEVGSYQIQENQECNDMGNGPENHAIQIKPQMVKLKLRPHETQSIKMTYRPARNFPLDLYYLMDLTWSMRDDKETLVGLRDELPATLKSLTNNFQLGFGSFADKEIIPFAEVGVKNPCRLAHTTCESLYEYKHRLKLTNNTSEFINKVNDSQVTGNLDDREGGLDALIQAIVCKNQVGWREEARRIVIFASDGGLHFAGDGKLGGVVKKNDGECRLSTSGLYEKDKLFDYPSLGQIYKLLRKHKVYVIFAVTDSQKEYSQLHDLLPNATYVGTLTSDSSNILDLVRRGYKDAASTATFIDNSSNFISTQYFSKCGSPSNPYSETNTCENVQIGESYEFKINFTLNGCPADKSLWKETIFVEEQQLTTGGLTVEVEMLCGCSCEEDGKIIRNHQNCSNRGDFVCGQCQCFNEWSGSNCSCNTKNEESLRKLEDLCNSYLSKEGKKAASDDPVWELVAKYKNESIGGERKSENVVRLCSGNGECNCGECTCDRGFYGKFCQCNDCPKTGKGLQCSGRGYCDCGTCQCVNGWSGADCSCSDGKESCIAPGDMIPCSGRGDCECGACSCHKDEYGNKYTRRYCEESFNSTNEICSKFQNCIKCHSDKSCANECEIQNAVVFEVQEFSDKENDICFFRITDDVTCDYTFTYSKVTPTNIKLSLKPVLCGVQQAYFQYMAFVATILIGIIGIAIWKVMQVRRDRIAFKKFEKEAKLTLENSWDRKDNNPLYVSPLSSYEVPDEIRKPRNQKVDSGSFFSMEPNIKTDEDSEL